ncbi:MAG: DUF1848 domain-containing protein [Planctomycetes bacterium]|nr:DUF1848 domain-containing protein [Planctomycetota bacterium]
MPRKIISASRRSDVPAFYSRWLLRRLEAGFCEWVNPFGGQLRRVSLRPEDCLALVFWTRNPAPLLPALRDIRAAGHCVGFHVTITGYPRELESHVPPLEASIRRARELAGIVGPEAVVWRYDPIVLSSLTPAEGHVERFGAIAEALEGATRSAYFSFVSLYGKTRRSFERVAREHGVAFREPEGAEKRELALRLAEVASRRGMRLFACCEDALVGDGIEKGRCVDIDWIRRLRPDAAEDLARRPTREQCGCTESVDIGAYDTCPFGCAYCYATRGRGIALQRLREHDPEDTLLWRPPQLRAGALVSQPTQVSGAPS